MSRSAALVAACLALSATGARAEESPEDGGPQVVADGGDSPVAAVDAGVPEVDAGVPEVDAGPPAAATVAAPVASVPAAEPPAEAAAWSLALPSSTRFYGSLSSRLGINPRFNSIPGQPLEENVADLRSFAVLGAEATFGDTVKIVVEGRLRHRAVEERQPTGQPFLLLNGRNAKATAEVTAGDAYLDWYTRYADLRFGNQVVTLGANAQFAPADVLTPNDLREGVFFNDPAEVKLPVPAVRARGDLLGFGWTVIYVPFFFPNRFDLYGQNEALIQPYPGMNFTPPPLDRSVEDTNEQTLIQTQMPKALPQEGDLGLRLTRVLGPVTVGADYAYTREKLPEVVIDPELARFITEGPQAPFTDPATALSLSQRFGAGETLVTGSYPRYQVGEVEASALLGPVQIDADVGYSPSRLLIDSHLNPVFHPLSTAVVTVADARGTDLTLAVSAIALWVMDIPQGEELLLLDLPGAQVKAHNTIGAGFVALAGYSLLHGRLNLEGRAFVDGRQWSRALGAKATWRFTDHVHGTVGGEFFGGPENSPFGYFSRADALYAQIRLDL